MGAVMSHDQISLVLSTMSGGAVLGFLAGYGLRAYLSRLRLRRYRQPWNLLMH